MDKLLVLFVTVPDREAASRISGTIVEERLAACINIISGIQSVFRWEGKIEESDELLLVIKTKRSCYQKLEARIIDLHPYDTPEVVALEAQAVAEKYLSWVHAETT